MHIKEQKSKSISRSRKIQNKQANRFPESSSSWLLNQQRYLGNQVMQRLHRTGVIQAKLKIGRPGDAYEREADRVADQVMRMGDTAVHLKTPLSTSTNSDDIQREENDKTGAVLSEGVTLTYEQMKEQPGFEALQKQQTDKLKLKLWDSQPAEAKAGIIGFGLSSLGLLGTTFALDPRFRSDTIDTLQDTNLLFLPNLLLPYSEYATLSSFKYNLPTAQFAPYTFETEFSLDAWFKLMQDKWNIPQVGLSVGIESAYSESAGFSPITGGNFKLKFGGGIVNLSGFYNQALPPTPMLISDPTAGEPPMWLMRSLPGQLEENLSQGSGVFLTVDVLRLPQLFNPPPKESVPTIQRMPNGAHSGQSMPAMPQSARELSAGQGKPLDHSTKRFMENRFRRNFSDVRIHTGNQAAEAAQSIHARAYTSGNHIVFGSGAYQPETDSGRRLLAHELTHVIQQEV